MIEEITIAEYSNIFVSSEKHRKFPRVLIVPSIILHHPSFIQNLVKCPLRESKMIFCLLSCFDRQEDTHLSHSKKKKAGS